MNPSDIEAAGREMHALAAELYPFCRSITGEGVRATLRRLARAWFQFAEKNPIFYRLALALLFTPPHSDSHSAASALHQRQYDVVNEVFKKAVKEAGNMRGREGLYAATFVGQVNSIIFLWLDGHLELNEQVMERTVHQFEHGIYS